MINFIELHLTDDAGTNLRLASINISTIIMVHEYNNSTWITIKEMAEPIRCNESRTEIMTAIHWAQWTGEKS